MNGPFGELAAAYQKAGYWPRPIKSGTKVCDIVDWQKPDPKWAPEKLEGWTQNYASHGIGLLVGSRFPDGTRLGVIDIDRDDRIALTGVLLGEPTSGRVGQKGVAYFVRLRGSLPNRALATKMPDESIVAVGDLLFDRKLCVIPPTIHPSTMQPYQWVGRPLLEVEYHELPIIEA